MTAGLGRKDLRKAIEDLGERIGSHNGEGDDIDEGVSQISEQIASQIKTLIGLHGKTESVRGGLVGGVMCIRHNLHGKLIPSEYMH